MLCECSEQDGGAGGDVQVTETDGMSAGDWQPPSADAELVPSTLSSFLLPRRRGSSCPSTVVDV